MQKANRASIEFALNWQSPYARHKDRIFVNKVDFWRDFFPGNMEQHISTLNEGEIYSENFDAGVLVDPYDKTKVIKFPEKEFGKNHNGRSIAPLTGRFYPQFLARSAFNCFSSNVTPFRFVGLDNGLMIADANHPLAKFPLFLEAKYIKTRPVIDEHGGLSNIIDQIVTANGPGMQIPANGLATDFYSIYPFSRNNEEIDSIFYKTPRFINHIDAAAQNHVQNIYSRLLSSGSKILDLMSSWVSHIPSNIQDYKAVGLGMNEEELKANRQLSDYVVHNLNLYPSLPFGNNEFDAVICTMSIEYLTQPLEIIKEVARVTKNGGLFITTFSDRWFQGKEIQPWSEMQPFERLGLVLDYYRKAASFTNLHTETVRGYSRPIDDKHIHERITSDPIFAVWGSIKD